MTDRKWVHQAGDEAACFMLSKDREEVAIVARFTVLGEPQSKSRPRVTKNGTYTPENVKTAERAIGWAFNMAARGHVPNGTDRFGVFALFFSGTRQRRDVDNMSKVVLDGLNDLAWKDDSQVVELSARKRFVDDKEHARIEVLVYLANSSPPLQNMTNCIVCDRQTRTYPSTNTRYCSKECVAAARASVEHACDHCGASFTRKKSATAARFCSKECKYASGRVEHPCKVCGVTVSARKSTITGTGHVFCSAACRQDFWRPRRAAIARGVCSSCSGPTSKKTYIQCAPCRQGRGARS